MNHPNHEHCLFPIGDIPPVMPQTRYQGSKRKIADWIMTCLEDLEYDTVLDAFGGTGSISWTFKRAGKAVTYNDILQFNHQVGIALIENSGTILEKDDIHRVLSPSPNEAQSDFITRTFSEIYFTDDENRFLDNACVVIPEIPCASQRALAWYALGQSAIAKRPYNLFHRKNLYMRLADVKRGFGNKKSWDRPFEEHFKEFARRGNQAVFDNGRPCRALRGDALDLSDEYDLVYIDTPYINKRGTGVDYHGFYHFLEGMLNYKNWESQLDRKSRHLRLLPQQSPWTKPESIGEAFSKLFERFESSILVVSYRSDGIPSIDELTTKLKRIKPSVNVYRYGKHQYALSTNRKAEEVLLVAS